ncbi:MAG: cytochrome c [Rhizobiaceae bacterium]
MKKLVFALAAAGMLFSGLAHADAISDRKAVMKEKVGASMGVLAKTAKGEMDFDAAAVLAAFQTINSATEGFADLFPAGSESGGETTASPKIWEDMDGFKAALAKLRSDAAAAADAAPQDKDAFMVVFGQVAGNCKACHETYRVMKN